MQLPWLRKYNLLIFDHTDSTNNEALNLAKSGVEEKFVIVAGEQGAGRGRQGRMWQSFAGNLHCSILLPNINNISDNLWQMPYIVANIVADSISSFKLSSNRNLPNIQVKWPNDILLNQKKLSGILLETLTVNNIQYLVIGIGVNIQKYPKENMPYEATSLIDNGFIIDSPEEVLNIIMVNFDQLFNKWQKHQNFARVKTHWLSRASNLNQAITVFDGQKRISGIFKKLSDNGALHIELSSGNLYEIFSGEIIDQSQL